LFNDLPLTDRDAVFSELIPGSSYIYFQLKEAGILAFFYAIVAGNDASRSFPEKM
jgi:hypothetical protein